MLAAWLPNLCMLGLTALLLRRHVHGSLRIGWAGLGVPGNHGGQEAND